MTRKEFAMLAEILARAYKKDKFLSETGDQEIWYQLLCDLPYKVALIAVNRWTQTEKWSPSIAEIRELSATILNERIPDVEDAWERVLQIARDYSPYDTERTEAQIESLDEISRRCIKLTDIRGIAYSENIGVERAHFIKAYERLAKEKKTQNQTAESVRNAISAIQPRRIEQKEELVHAIPVFSETQRDDSEFAEELRQRFL